MGKNIFLFLLLTLVPVCRAAVKPDFTPSDTAGIASRVDSVPPPVPIAQPFYDADSVFIGTYYYSGTRLDSTVYVKPDGERLRVDYRMPEYEGGYDSLQVFFDREFDRIECKEPDLNALALVYILIEEGRIADIRIGDRIAYHNFDLNYDEAIKAIVRRTEGRWIMPVDETSPLLFVYLFTLN